jgi:hypothetical protein
MIEASYVPSRSLSRMSSSEPIGQVVYRGNPRRLACLDETFARDLPGNSRAPG